MFQSSEPQEKDNEYSQKVLEDLMLELIDDVACGLCFEVHRACKLGTFMLDETDLESQKQFEIVNEVGLDVFGQVPAKKQYECPCPNCSRSLAASRFAPHLEKCMGMGRISSRIASRRIATNTGKKQSDFDSEENDDENDLSYWPDRKGKRAKREKHGGGVSSRKNAKLKGNDRRKKLGSSEHSKKTSNRSVPFPAQHPSVKQLLLGQNRDGDSSTTGGDVDFDMNGGGSSSQLWDSASNSSPADSFSTVNS